MEASRKHVWPSEAEPNPFKRLIRYFPIEDVLRILHVSHAITKEIWELRIKSEEETNKELCDENDRLKRRIQELHNNKCLAIENDLLKRKIVELEDDVGQIRFLRSELKKKFRDALDLKWRIEEREWDGMKREMVCDFNTMLLDRLEKIGAVAERARELDPSTLHRLLAEVGAVSVVELPPQFQDYIKNH